MKPYPNPNLKALRLQHNYKQEYVADLLGISQPEYSKMENGVRKLDAYTIKELCKLYDISIDVLMQPSPQFQPVLMEVNSVLPNQQGYVSQDIITKLMDNYTFLLDSFLKQQQMQEVIIKKLIGDRSDP